MEKDIRYIYFGKKVSSVNGSGVVSVGYSYNSDLGKMLYSVAFCSPNDRFVKDKSRRIINARFDNNMTEQSVTSFDKKPVFRAVVRDVIEKFATEPVKFAGIHIPRWCTQQLFNVR